MTRLPLLGGAVALTASLAMAACVSALGLTFVTVATAVANVSLPVPLALPRAAVAFLPDGLLDAAEERELGAALAALGALADALEDVPDGFALVEVEEPGTSVRIAKDGDALAVRVDDRDQRVRVSAPIAALAGAAAACGPERCDLKALARAVLGEAQGLRVEVRDGEYDVRIGGF